MLLQWPYILAFKQPQNNLASFHSIAAPQRLVRLPSEVLPSLQDHFVGADAPSCAFDLCGGVFDTPLLGDLVLPPSSILKNGTLVLQQGSRVSVMVAGSGVVASAQGAFCWWLAENGINRFSLGKEWLLLLQV